MNVVNLLIIFCIVISFQGSEVIPFPIFYNFLV